MYLQILLLIAIVSFINLHLDIRDFTGEIDYSPDDNMVVLFYYPWDGAYQAFFLE